MGGTLRASTECQLLALDSCKFQIIVGAFTSPHAGNYAKEFVDSANQHLDQQTDVGECNSALVHIILQTFPDEWPRVKDEFSYPSRITMQRPQQSKMSKGHS